MKSDIPERSLELARGMVMLCRMLDAKPGTPRILAIRLVPSGTSIGANVEEAQASQSDADLVSSYSIACKEARETHYWLRLLVAAGIPPEDRLSDLQKECGEIIAILTTIIKRMRIQRR
jgi:four helix bundle protein